VPGLNGLQKKHGSLPFILYELPFDAMKTCPKIVLDISTLGFAQDERSAARGVHRVAEFLFKGLKESGQCDLRFVSTSHLAGAYEFLDCQGLSPEKSLGFYKSQLALSRISRTGSRWVKSTLSNRSLTAKAMRRLVAEACSIGVSRERLFPADILKGADIYHSMLAPIPKMVRANKALKHFLTVYDLIPLTNPGCLAGDAKPYITSLLGSIDRNSYAFCIAEGVKADLLNFTDLQPEKVFVTYLAADPETFYLEKDTAKIQALAKKYKIPEAPYFLSLSSFDPRKNFGHIIDCFSRLVRSHEIGDCNLLIVGSNPERNTFVEEALARYPEIKERIITPGFIPDSDLAAIYSGAVAFLFPSHGEGFGIPPLEAMQCGTPVISSNAPVLPEVLGDAAILLDPRDADSWCQAMISVSSNALIQEELRQKGLARAAEYSWKRFTESTLQGYRTALQQ
jgi:glycosyltransferase involved in cell wall biosynthesis